MKNGFKFYVVFWFILVVVFNVISFVSVGWDGQEKYTVAFWCGYVFIMISFLINILLASVALRKKDIKNIFYNISFLRTNYVSLILAFVVGGVFMLTPFIPYWVCILITAIVMGSNGVYFIKAKAAANIVAEIDEEVVKNTQFVKLLIADVQSLMSVAKDEETRQLVKKVYEAARYSDPVSNVQLESVEKQIEIEFATFSKAVRNGSDDVVTTGNELMYLINNRNEKCKALK